MQHLGLSTGSAKRKRRSYSNSRRYDLVRQLRHRVLPKRREHRGLVGGTRSDMTANEVIALF